MVITFRQINEMEKKAIQNELNYWLSSNEIERMLRDYSFTIAEGKWKEILISNVEVAEILFEKGISPYSIGANFGEFKEDSIELGLFGLQLIGEKTNKTVVITPEAEQAFLYRKDIYFESIVEINDSLKKDDKVIVRNKEGDVLGVGKISLDLQNKKMKKQGNIVAIRNLMDLGWYLRKGK